MCKTTKMVSPNPSKRLNPDAKEWRPRPPPQPPAQWLTPPPQVAAAYYVMKPHHMHNIPPYIYTFHHYNTQPQLPTLHFADPQKPLYSTTTAATHGGGTVVKSGQRVIKRGARGRYEGCRRRRKSPPPRLQWMPKNSKNKSNERWSPPPPSPPTSGSSRTTVMIRNIPNQFRRHMLLGFLDKLCQEQNQNENESHKADDDDDKELESHPNYHALRFEYDFLYLPIDFEFEDNLGYAFVNFTSATAASKIRKLLHNYKWGDFEDINGNLCQSKKICEITWAKIQGAEELVKHFVNCIFMCEKKEYLPVIFSPPRDGVVCALPYTIGTCLASNTY